MRIKQLNPEDLKLGIRVICDDNVFGTLCEIKIFNNNLYVRFDWDDKMIGAFVSHKECNSVIMDDCFFISNKRK